MVHATDLPAHALLSRYRGSGYTDCYVTPVPCRVTAAEFIEAFYTTPIFKLERWLLSVLRLPSTDMQARELALGQRASFAAWTVEARDEHQVLLAAGRTRSWLCVMPATGPGTNLFFGSAVVPRRSSSGAQRMGVWFWALAGFHRAYSRALLQSTRRRLGVQAKARPRAGRDG